MISQKARPASSWLKVCFLILNTRMMILTMIMITMMISTKMVITMMISTMIMMVMTPLEDDN